MAMMKVAKKVIQKSGKSIGTKIKPTARAQGKILVGKTPKKTFATLGGLKNSVKTAKTKAVNSVQAKVDKSFGGPTGAARFSNKQKKQNQYMKNLRSI